MCTSYLLGFDNDRRCCDHHHHHHRNNNNAEGGYIVNVSGKVMSNLDIVYYVEKIRLPHFVGVFMRVKQFLESKRPAVRYHKSQHVEPDERSLDRLGVCTEQRHLFFFDPFDQNVPIELQTYLKTKKELALAKRASSDETFTLFRRRVVASADDCRCTS